MQRNALKRYSLEVTGDFACFTRPEMKVERVSYDVITPSAARGILESIFWKPAIRWAVRQIDVLRPIQWANVRRNEVGFVMSNNKGHFIEDNRQQRAGLILRDVAYVLHADMIFIPVNDRCSFVGNSQERSEPDSCAAPIDETPSKYHDIFERRVAKGQCFNQPYLGCREFSVSAFKLMKHNELPTPIADTRDFGYMLCDMDYDNENGPAPAFFRAVMENGRIMVPDRDSQEVFQ